MTTTLLGAAPNPCHQRPRIGGEAGGLDLARELIHDKILGHARNLTTYFSADEEASTLLDLAEAVMTAETLDAVRGIEATAAALYWQVWAGRPETATRFAAKDRRRAPATWSAPFETRRSPLRSANGNKKAATPCNSIANYLFGLLETEAILACHAVGLDPGLSLIHSPTRDRQSMALDLMEPVRPAAEAMVLDLLCNRTFRKVDFAHLPDGHCRLMAPLAHEIAESAMPKLAALVAPVAEKVAHALGQAMAGKYVAHTPLPRRRSMDAAAVVKARKATSRRTAASEIERQRPAARNAAGSATWSCPDCGSPVVHRDRIRCDACIDADPRQTPAVRAKRSQAIASRKRVVRERDDAGLPIWCDRDWYRATILPRLADLKLREIMDAAQCSKGFASVIRSGRNLPHVNTWTVLARLVGVAIEEPAPAATNTASA